MSSRTAAQIKATIKEWQETLKKFQKTRRIVREFKRLNSSLTNLEYAEIEARVVEMGALAHEVVHTAPKGIPRRLRQVFADFDSAHHNETERAETVAAIEFVISF